jgi:hypothetical protein
VTDHVYPSLLIKRTPVDRMAFMEFDDAQAPADNIA